jgi:hypothetical protein
MTWFRRRPKPPVGVKLHMRDGTTLVVDCVYVGKVRHRGNRHETDRWQVVQTKMPPYAEVDHISIDLLPGRAEVVF